MRKNVSFAAIAAVVALAAASIATGAFAAKGGGSATSTISSIAIASIDGTVVTPASTASSPTPKLGDTLRFATKVEPLAGWEYPMVELSCYQDVNGDGVLDTSVLGPDIVFSWLDRPAADFTLGASVSIWTLRGGGAAVCRANLDAYGWKGGKESTRVLATTGLWNALG